MGILNRLKIVFMLIAVVYIACLVNVGLAVLPSVPKLGGAYSEILRQDYDHGKYEVHHLISKTAWNIFADEVYYSEGKKPWNDFLFRSEVQGWAPSILMEKEDHEKTLSYWRPGVSDWASMASDNYIDYQADVLIHRGDAYYLLREEYQYIKIKFGNKYDQAIKQMYNYTERMFFLQGGSFFIRNPDRDDWFVRFRLQPLK